MIQLSTLEISFPDPRLYDPKDGLIAYGGDLSVERVLFAYQNGIFPWYEPEEEILWWSPDPRFVLNPESVKISKSMRKILDKNVFTFTENKDFENVIRNCQKIKRENQSGTWLSEDLLSTFLSLHKLGYAKSVEVWQDEQLVGGLYGIEINSVFCGESMFANVSNASKAGFIYFVKKHQQKYTLIDCQVYTKHLESLGAIMIPKLEFLSILNG